MRHPNYTPANLPIISLREPRTCDELGVCQHLTQCAGVCDRHTAAPVEAGNYWPDIGPARSSDRPEPVERIDQRPAIGTPFDEFTFWALCFAAYAAIFAVLGYLWGRHGDKFKAALSSLWA